MTEHKTKAELNELYRSQTENLEQRFKNFKQTDKDAAMLAQMQAETKDAYEIELRKYPAEKPAPEKVPAPKALKEVLKDPSTTEKEVTREKAHLKSMVIEGVKSGKFKGAVRFSTAIDLKKTVKNDKLYVSREGVIHATPILGPDDDAFPAYGSYKNHPVAYIIPEKYVKSKPDAHTKEVLIDPDTPLDEVTFLVDGQDRPFHIVELISALDARPTPEEVINQYTEKYGESEALEFHKEVKGRQELFSWMGAVVHRSTVEPDGWRITFFDAAGFSGHTEHKTIEGAVGQAIDEGYLTPKPGILDKAAERPEFIEQTTKVYKAQKEHAAKLAKIEMEPEKELYQMTKDEQLLKVGRPVREHREAIVAAHKAGKTIPTEVLDDFPEISKRLGFKKKEKAKEPPLPLPKVVALWPPTKRETFKVDKSIERATRDLSIEGSTPDGIISADFFSGAPVTPEFVLESLDSNIQSYESLSGRLGGKNVKAKQHASPLDMMESWVGANQWTNVLNAWKKKFPAGWTAYTVRQERVKSLKPGDRVYVPLGNFKEDTQGAPGAIVKQNRVNWVIKIDELPGTVSFKPAHLRPGEALEKEAGETGEVKAKAPVTETKPKQKEWQALKVGDVFYDELNKRHLRVFGKGMTKKYEAQALADENDGVVWIDTGNKWAVVAEVEPLTLTPEQGTPWERQAELEKEGVIERPAKGKKVKAKFGDKGITGAGIAGRQQGLFGVGKGETSDMFAEAEEKAKAEAVTETADDVRNKIYITTAAIERLRVKKDRLKKQAVKHTPASARRSQLTADSKKITDQINPLLTELTVFQAQLKTLEKQDAKVFVNTLDQVRADAKAGKKAGIDYTTQMEVAETGDIVEVTTDAGTALNEADNRMENYNKLLECIESD